MRVSLPHNLWSTERAISLDLPEGWDVNLLRMAGDGKPVAGPAEYRAALSGLPTLLKGAREICVLFDDLSRPTRAYEIVPYLLEAFDASGIRDEQVRFLCSLGTHSPHNNSDFRKKLGEEVLERFPVFNHNCYEHCDLLGKTSFGTPVAINSEYMRCDLRIGIGAFLPHQFCGFGGGYKIVFPGLAHIDSITYHHGELLAKNMEACWGLGRHDGNVVLADIREAGKMAGIDYKIDVFVNSSARATDVFAGDPEELYPDMIERAVPHYFTPTEGEYDIVFVNTFGKANEAIIAAAIGEPLLSRKGGYIVLLCDIEEGQVIHYLLGRFGKDLWGRLSRKERTLHERVKKLVIYSRRKDHAGSYWFGKKEDIVWAGDLGTLVGDLDKEYGGRARAAVMFDGTIQMIG